MNLNENVAASAAIGCPVATAGELFTDGAMIELIGGDRSAPLQLMLWDGSKETGRRVRRQAV